MKFMNLQRGAYGTVEESVFKFQNRLLPHCWAEYVQSKNMPSYPKSVTDTKVFRRLKCAQYLFRGAPV